MSYDPRRDGAKCDICPLGPKGCLRKEEPWSPIPTEHKDSDVAIVAETPGPAEVEQHMYMAGVSGGELERTLQSIGQTRGKTAILSVLPCKPEGDKASGLWSKMEAELKRVNDARKAAGLPPHPHPVDCCKPRLFHDLEPYENVIVMGKRAYQALTGKAQGIFKARGSFYGVYLDGEVFEPAAGGHDVEDAWWRVYPTFHPAFISRAPGYRHLWQLDLAKAYRWFRGEMRWAGYDVLRHPTPDELEDWYEAHRHLGQIIVDTETDVNYRTQLTDPSTGELKWVTRKKSPRTNYLRTICFAFRGPKRPTVAGTWFLGDDGESRFWPRHFEDEFFRVIRRILEDPDVVKVAHNMNFDQQVLERIGGDGGKITWPVSPLLPGHPKPRRVCRVEPVLDTLAYARAWGPAMPKGLKFVGTVLTDIGHWESDDKGEAHITKAGNDHPRLVYCEHDVAVLDMTEEALDKEARAVGYMDPLPPEFKPADWDREWTLRGVDHYRRENALGMSQMGVHIDEEKRQKLASFYERISDARLLRVKKLASDIGVSWDDKMSMTDEEAGDLAFNPNSYNQLRDLLYEDWKLGIPKGMSARDFYTDTGLPGTGDTVLRAHIASGLLKPDRQAFLENLRLLRRERSKILGTILYKMAQPGVHWKGRCDDDGRVRGSWTWHVTPIARYSCSGVPLQVIGNRKGQGPLKGIFRAAPGRVFIGGDIDQAHLRIIAEKWGVSQLRDALLKGWDPHGQTALGLYGDSYRDGGPEVWPKGYSPAFKPEDGQPLSMRNTSKVWIYAIAYAAGLNLHSDGTWDFWPSTIWQVMSATEFVDEVWVCARGHENIGKSDKPCKTCGGASLQVVDFKATMPYSKGKWNEARIVWMFERFMKNQPDWIRAWLEHQELYRKNGYGETYLFKRRNNALAKLNEQVNYPVLGTEQEIAFFIEWALTQLVSRGSLGDNTGLVYQGHDAFAIEVPGEIVDSGKVDKQGKPIMELRGEARGIFPEVRKAMNFTIPGWQIPVTSDVRFGYTLKDVT